MPSMRATAAAASKRRAPDVEGIVYIVYAFYFATVVMGIALARVAPAPWSYVGWLILATSIGLALYNAQQYFVNQRRHAELVASGRYGPPAGSMPRINIGAPA